MSSETIAVSGIASPAKTRALRRPFLTARWQLVAMLNWEIDAAIVAPLVPCGCELDFHRGMTYLSVVGFLFLDTRVLGLPIPGHCNFEEVNLRFYVRRAGSGGLRRGVAFVKEIVPRWTIAQTARLCYNEPYVALPMEHDVTGPAAELQRRKGQRTENRGPPAAGGEVCYRWRYGGRWNAIELRYQGERVPLTPGSHEAFIADHYYGYCGQCDGGTVEYQLEHSPWNIWGRCTAKLDADVAALYGEQFAPVLSQPPTSAFLADGSPVALMRPIRL
jgi:uncharacterized protein